MFSASRSTKPESKARSCSSPRHSPAARPNSTRGSHPALDRSDAASHHSPTNPILRANPFPEVTDLICRLPLPTLFYRLEAVHLGDLLRISVRSGTRFSTPPSVFQGPSRAQVTPQEPWRFTETTSLSPAEPFPGSPFLNQKRELWLGHYSASPSSFALPLKGTGRHPISVFRYGNINPFPFRHPRAKRLHPLDDTRH